MAPKSLTTTPTRVPRLPPSRWLSNVVLPEPRNPATTTTGIRFTPTDPRRRSVRPSVQLVPNVGRSRSGGEGDEVVHGGVDGGEVVGGDQVQEQAAGDGEAQAGAGGGDVGRVAEGALDGRDGFQPVGDDAVQQRGGAGTALDGLGVQLEEQALV